MSVLAMSLWLCAACCTTCFAFLARQEPAEKQQQLDAMVPTQNVLHVRTGFELATHFNSEVNWVFRRWHIMDNVICGDYSMGYIDNVEAEVFPIVSTLLADESCELSQEEFELPYTGTGTGQGGTSPAVEFNRVDKELTSDTLNESGVGTYFFWSIVRDPLQMFESQVKSLRDQGVTTLSADELMDEQLIDCNATAACTWVNQHLQPSSWRLGSFVGGSRVELGFIVRAENFANDWPDLLAHLEDVPSSLQATLAPMQMTLPAELPVGDPAKLSDDFIRRMCSSEIYGSEWDYFGYEKPVQCQLSAEEYISSGR